MDAVTDAEVERRRYDRAAHLEAERFAGVELPSGVSDMGEQFHAPYYRYYERISNIVRPDSVVLELAAGGGRHTVAIAENSSRTIALDVSEESLKLCRQRTNGHASPVCGDITSIPLRDSSVDVVVCAGGLSYGDPAKVDAEIRRVLRPGGSVILVDTLNHNPVYRLNRWINYRRGLRTLATVQRMPTFSRINRLSRHFSVVTVECFGTYVFLHPILSRAMGADRATAACEYLDAKFGRGRNGFKFVCAAEGLIKAE